MLIIPTLLIAALGVAVLSTVIPFSLDFIVLRQTSARVFGLLLSLEPAIAVLLGWILLGEPLMLRSFFGIALIMIAMAGQSQFQSDC